MAPVFGRIAFPEFEQAIPIRTIDGITSLLDKLPACHKTIAPEVQGSDSGGQELVIRDGVSGAGLCYTNCHL